MSRRSVLRAGAAIGLVGAAGGVAPAAGFAAPEGSGAQIRSQPQSQTQIQSQTQTITGRFTPGAPDWVYVPVEVPPGIGEIEVSYHYDRPPVPPGMEGNALDIGIFDAAGFELGNAAGFRGWSGGFRDRFALSAAAATPGYLPGPIGPGTWHVVLGPYTVAPQGLNYEVTVVLRAGEHGAGEHGTGEHGGAFWSDPAPERATGRGRAWYRGDAHLHTVHSDGERTPAELVARAREAGLDFIVSTEHNTPSASLIWGAHAGPDLLVIDGEEVTTRAGHWLALGLPTGAWIDWRYRDQAQFRRFVDQVHRLGGLAVAAHPYCPFKGCPWEFGYQAVDGIEVWNGPWTLDDELAVATWHGLLGRGQYVPALGNSDAHREPQVVGLPQNVVLAEDLTTPAVLAGLRAGHSYLAESAEVDLAVRARSGERQVGIGQRLDAAPEDTVQVRVEVTGAPGATLRLLTPTGPAHMVPVRPDGTGTLTFDTRPALTPWVRVEVRRPTPTETTPDTMVALSNPVFLGV